MQPFPTPVMLHIKFDQNWPTGLRDIQVRNFRHSKASNSKVSSLIRPEIKLVRAFMLVLVTSDFDDDSIKNERASMETTFSQYKSMGKYFRCSRAANSVVKGPIWPKFELVRDFMHVLVTCKYKKDRIKNNREKVETSFSPLQVNGGFLLQWKPEFWSNLPQTLTQPFPHFPTPVMLHNHTIWSGLANWFQRYSSLKVWMTDGWTTDGRRTIGIL